MEEPDDHGQNITLILLLVLSFILVFVDTLELYQLTVSWQYGVSIISPVFESCIKWELYTKTIFCVFSFLGAISSFILTLFLLISSNWFAEKILSTFLYFNYLIFGPYMLGFCILGFMNWNNVVFTCDRQNYSNKVLSASNVFSLIGCFIIACLITCFVSIYKTVMLYFDSILRRSQGSAILRKLFWWVVFRNREPVEYVRSTVNNPNQGANQGNNIPENRENRENPLNV
jgi:hypothetical protein